jgi:dihydrodipicolinate synthase/N-acetylneuraminate lyase
MEASTPPRGLIADLITPLKRDGSIDGDGLKGILDRVIPYSQAVFLAGPRTGEGINLNGDQLSGLLKKTLNLISGRLPILIWVTQNTEEKTRKTIQNLNKTIQGKRDHGQVFLVDTPLYYHSNRGLPAYYRDVCSMSDQPFILHNDPELIRAIGTPFKRCNIRTSIVKELIALKNIVGIIFLGPIDRAYNYQKACRGRSGFRIYDGDETNFMSYPSTSGVVSAGANLAPVAWQRIVSSSLHLKDEQGNGDDMRQIWELGQYLRSLKDVYQKMPVAVIKEILSDMGIIKTPACTFPAEDMGKQKNEIKELMARSGDYM